jgi:hypothetical protein
MRSSADIDTGSKNLGARLRPGVRNAQMDAFGRWLDQELRNLYEPVLDEPIPDSLLDLLRPEARAQCGASGTTSG